MNSTMLAFAGGTLLEHGLSALLESPRYFAPAIRAPMFERDQLAVLQGEGTSTVGRLRWANPSTIREFCPTPGSPIRHRRCSWLRR